MSSKFHNGAAECGRSPSRKCCTCSCSSGSKNVSATHHAQSVSVILSRASVTQCFPCCGMPHSWKPRPVGQIMNQSHFVLVGLGVMGYFVSAPIFHVEIRPLTQTVSPGKLHALHKTSDTRSCSVEGGEIRPRKEGKDNDNFIFKALPLPVRVPCLSYTGGEGPVGLPGFCQALRLPFLRKHVNILWKILLLGFNFPFTCMGSVLS